MPSESPYIDVHHHAIPPVYREALSGRRIAESGGLDLPDWSPELSLGVMDRNEIATAVLSVSAPGIHFGDDADARELARRCNEASAEAVESHPTRFGFFAILPMPDVDGSVAEAAYAIDVLGADGVVLLSSHHDGSYLGDPRFDAVLAELDRRSAVAFVHPVAPAFSDRIGVGIPAFAMEFTFDTTRAAFNLAYTGALERYPNIRFVLSHAGGTVPYLVARFDLLWFVDGALAERAPKGGSSYMRSLYYDTALSANPHALSSLTELVGADHILFGSDYPFAPELATRMTVDGVADYPFTDPDRARVRRGTALDLLPSVARRLNGTGTP
ncbi:MAG: amidohydrolase family protein [Acidimicrobiales bacterium]|jgi:predicted TIM-barrel fold metal-dependent hydrolase